MKMSNTPYQRNKVQTAMMFAICAVFYLSEHSVVSLTLFLVLAGYLVWAFIDIGQKAKPESTVPQTVITLAARLVILGLLFLLVWYSLSYKVKLG